MLTLRKFLPRVRARVFLSGLNQNDKPASELNDHGLGLNVLSDLVGMVCEDVDLCIGEVVLVKIGDLITVSSPCMI